MFEKCPEKVKKCQQPKEYDSFEKEFLLDIEATIAAMEDVCPVAKKTSLKSCPVFTKHNMSYINYVNINSLTNLTAFANTKDVLSNAFNSNDGDELVNNKNVLDNIQNSFVDEIKVELNENDYLENLLFPTNDDIIDNLPAKSDENASVVLFENIDHFYNLLWNKSDTNNMEIGNILPEEKEICQDSDSYCIITKLLLALAIVFIVVLVIAFVVLLFQDRCLHRIRVGNQKFIRRL
jgi:hypothetical protein